MYPNLYYLIDDLFGVKLNGLRLVNSFGFFVAIAFVASGFVLYSELKRKESLGEFTPTEESIIIGAPASLSELLTSFFFGFLFGYKIIGAFTIADALNNTQAFILSLQGNIGAGILVGGIMVYLKWKEKDKEKLAKPETRKLLLWPHDRVGDIVLQAALWGFLGAKIFHNLENLDELMLDPWGSLISFSGLTFYGGLILATIAIVVFILKYNMRVIHFADAMAPTMLFAYAAGRIGCHISGDGDWGIVNSAPNPFAWLPDWMWSYQYPHNVVNAGVSIPGCVGNYCNQLPEGVYPTTFYEVIIMFILFLIVWMVRKKITQPGIITGIYFIFAGGERFFIEKIRVNNKYNFLPFQPTQAELISVILIILGIVFLVKSKSWFPKDIQKS
ncbi:MAG: prolipoprotein diacylglyceryl transferase [Sediminibacterium sp.]|jgi:phosphatidylglycerol---prolipoprotein diacylglyceryl transferase|nr:prolipoprotein diacylglyceryl transferase [Sediminibacterium sp.]